MACIHYSKFRNIQVRGLVSVIHGNCQVLASSDSSLVILAQFIFGINGGYISTTLSLSTSTWLGRVVMGVDFPHTHGVILPTSAVLLRVSESSGGNNATT